MGKKKNLLVNGLVALSMVAPHFAAAQSKAVERPPQFVLLAFDGSYNNDVWQYSRDFSKNHKARTGKDVKFTFFINPSYLLTEDPSSNRHYHAPHKSRAGTSNIGWGDDNKDVGLRVDQMNEAHREGHEIASHTVGHYDGSNWTREQWQSEFSQFEDILKNFFDYNNMGPTPMGYNQLSFGKSDIIGFRAPQLGYNAPMYVVLNDFGFKYDTSTKTDVQNYWPEKKGKIWNFPLTIINAPGTGQKWVSMDYNFCARDSARILRESPQTIKLTQKNAKGKVIKNGNAECLNVITKEQKKVVKENMLRIYRSYFAKNYDGNRGPIHIGHHFSSWMSGAYLEAFFEFANEVCSVKEVRCATYAELQTYMEDRLKDKQLTDLQAGNFKKMTSDKSAGIPRHLDLSIQIDKKDDALVFALTGKDSNMKGLKKLVTVGDKTQEFDGVLNLKDVRNQISLGGDATISISVKDRLKKEIVTSSYKIEHVGTPEEKVNLENLEEAWLQGDMPGAHKDEHNH